MIAPRPYASAALAAALLAVPVAGLAQPKARTPAAARPAPTATPAARPAPVPAPEPAAPPIEERGPWRLAGSIGFENDSDAELKGPRLQVELERDLVPLGQRGLLSFVAAVAWFRGTSSDSVSLGGMTASTDVTQNLLEAVPSFRAGYALVPRLRVFAEIGVGGGWAFTSSETTLSPGTFPKTTTSDDRGFGVLRLGAGSSYQVNERLRVGVLLPTWSKRYGAQGTSSTLSFSAMAAYAF